ncbi:hypothetical protein BH10BAC2_BH10BAC2_31470 [soil metagenome]
MENISEPVMMFMIVIAAIQFVIILKIIKSDDKKSHPGYAGKKRSLIE